MPVTQAWRSRVDTRRITTLEPMDRQAEVSPSAGGSSGPGSVAVVIPGHNAEAYIGETIESVMAQSFQQWTLLVVDDCSSDRTRSVVEAFAEQDPRISLIAHARNRGAAAARNTGAGATDSEYLLFLDADDVLEPDMLAATAGHLDRHPGTNAVYVRQSYLDATGKRLGDEPGRWPWARCVATRFWVAMVPDSEPTVPFESIYLVAAIIPSIAVVRRDAFDRIGRWDEEFGQICEDTDFFLRLRLDGMIHFLPRVLVGYRQHPTQATVTKGDLFAAQYAKVHQRIAAVAGPDTSLVADAEWFRQHRFVPYRRLTAARDALRAGDVRGLARNLKGAVASYSPAHPPGSLFRT
jgi:glycosyltransferase involved in cell wall biosynthesis